MLRGLIHSIDGRFFLGQVLSQATPTGFWGSLGLAHANRPPQAQTYCSDTGRAEFSNRQ